LLISASTQSV